MSRQIEQHDEDRNSRRRREIILAIDGGLEAAVSRSGATLTGLAVNINAVECLLVIKGVLAGRKQVCFVGSATFGDALVKAVRLGNRDKLAWRADKYGT